MKTAVVWFGACLAAALPAGAGDQPPSPPVNPAASTAAPAGGEAAEVRKADEAFVRAYNAGDAKAVAALFTDDAEVFDEHGGAARGRKAIEDLYGDVFKESKGAKLEVALDTLRSPTADTALATGRSRVTPAGGGAPVVSRYTVLYVRKGGRWLQSFVQESAETPVSPHEHLKALEWLTGDWVDEGPDGVVFTTGKWSEDKNFMLREFAVHLGGKHEMTVTERIGWDPAAGQFKSWVFDSEGGHSEGEWSHDGDRWIVRSTGVLPDGRKSAATQIFTVVNKQTVRWRTVDRSIGSQAQPDGVGIVLVRRPPRPR